MTVQNEQAASRKSGWPLAIVAITFLLLVGLPAAYVAVTWSHAFLTAPQRVVQTLAEFAADAARPKVQVNQLVLSTIADLHKQSKLVVLKTTINADVTRQESSSRFGMYWGTNTARVLLRDARVQYSIDLAGTSTANYSFDPKTNVLTLALPRPRLDTDVVGIDPARISTLDLRGGWALFDKGETRERAIAELRPTVITEANSPVIKQQAEEAGREALAQWLHPLADSLGKEGVKLQVEWM